MNSCTNIYQIDVKNVEKPISHRGIFKWTTNDFVQCLKSMLINWMLFGEREKCNTNEIDHYLQFNLIANNSSVAVDKSHSLQCSLVFNSIAWSNDGIDECRSGVAFTMQSSPTVCRRLAISCGLCQLDNSMLRFWEQVVNKLFICFIIFGGSVNWNGCYHLLIPPLIYCLRLSKIYT